MKFYGLGYLFDEDIFFTFQFIVIFLGVLFLYFQFIEYSSSFFSIRDGVYGRVFYGLTGLHIGHVIVGLISLSFLYFHFLYNYINLLDSLWLEISSLY